jgi:hypothetical protein
MPIFKIFQMVSEYIGTTIDNLCRLQDISYHRPPHFRIHDCFYLIYARVCQPLVINTDGAIPRSKQKQAKRIPENDAKSKNHS